MAARRIVKSTVDWAALAERVPAAQKTNFTAFKAKSDKILRSVMANPEAPPAIDWAYYKSRVAVAGLVDNFQKQYDALKVPYPADNYSSKVDAQRQQVQSEINSFVSESKARIGGFQKDVSHLQSLLPYDQMTMEDYRDSFPEEALDPINKPTYWPHTADEQEGYKQDDPAQQASH